MIYAILKMTHFVFSIKLTAMTQNENSNVKFKPPIPAKHKTQGRHYHPSSYFLFPMGTLDVYLHATTSKNV